jgi:hypothetical protein
MTSPYGSRRGAEACRPNKPKKVRPGGLRGRLQEKVIAWIPVRPRAVGGLVKHRDLFQAALGLGRGHQGLFPPAALQPDSCFSVAFLGEAT